MTAILSTSPSRLSVVDPYLGTTLTDLPMLSPADADRALDAAWQRHSTRERWLKPHERRRYLEALLGALEKDSESLAVQATHEGGKPIADSRVEVARGLEGLRETIRILCHRSGRVIPMGHTEGSAPYRATTQFEPRGVVLAIGAFNHPFNIIVHQLAPALAAGCPILLKPSLDTPLSCLALVERLHRLGIGEDQCKVLLCDNATTAKLAADPRVSFVHFVGSAAVGWQLRRNLAPGSECALEHGGAAPVILDRGYPFETILPALVRSGFYHAGQVCISTQRIFVHRSDFRAFTAAFCAVTAAVTVGDPLQAQTLVGPMIRSAEVERIHDWVQRAAREGAQLACGGCVLGNNLYSPTVLIEPPATAKVSQDEVFAPVVCLYAYDHLGEAVARANAVRYAFHSSFFSRDIDRADWVSRHLEASALLINETPAFRVDWMPFGGYRDSGVGSGDFGGTIAQFSREKLIIQRIGSTSGTDQTLDT